LVAKQAGQAAGGFAGGFFNNPGVVAVIGIVAAILIPLLIFRKNIAEFFNQGVQLPDVNIEIPNPFEGFEFPNPFEGFEFPSFELPSFELPSFEFPSFELPSFEFPSIDLPDLPGVIDDIFNPQDAPTGESEGEAVDFTESGMAAARGERGGDTGGILKTQPIDDAEFRVTRELIETPFAVENVEESQEEFQARSSAFAEAFPRTTFSTSLDGGEVPFESLRQLSRNQEDFQEILDREAQRSESIFAALFGNVQNPDFGA